VAYCTGLASRAGVSSVLDAVVAQADSRSKFPLKFVLSPDFRRPGFPPPVNFSLSFSDEAPFMLEDFNDTQRSRCAFLGVSFGVLPPSSRTLSLRKRSVLPFLVKA